MKPERKENGISGRPCDRSGALIISLITIVEAVAVKLTFAIIVISGSLTTNFLSPGRQVPEVRTVISPAKPVPGFRQLDRLVRDFWQAADMIEKQLIHRNRGLSLCCGGRICDNIALQIEIAWIISRELRNLTE